MPHLFDGSSDTKFEVQTVLMAEHESGTIFRRSKTPLVFSLRSADVGVHRVTVLAERSFCKFSLLVYIGQMNVEGHCSSSDSTRPEQNAMR